MISSRSAVIGALVLTSCASSPEQPSKVESQALAAEETPETPKFVVISRLSPLYLAPSKSAPQLLYRTPEEQTAKVEEMNAARERDAERLQKRAEKQAERDEKRAKREKKRLRKLRGDRREAYREKLEERAKEREREAAEGALDRKARWASKYAGEAAHEHLFAAELVERRDGWVGVRPIRPETPRCYAGAATRLQALDVVFWTPEENLLDVVTKRVRVPVAEGTEVILAGGVAMKDGRAFVNGFELGLNVPQDAVGMTYEGVRGFEAPYTETVFSPVAYANDWLRLEKDAPLPFNPWFPLHVTATLYVGDRFYATTQTPCAEFTLRTIEEALEPVGERGAMRLGGSEDRVVEPPMFVAGAALFSPSGESIGTARVDLPVVDELESTEGRTCWHYVVWDGDAGQRRVPICSADADFRALTLTEGL